MKLNLKLINWNLGFSLTIIVSHCLFGVSCKRSGGCVPQEKNFYYDIPDSTGKYILNRKGETLVFSNMKGDTISFFCSDSIHQNILLKSNDLGLNDDCANIENTFSESYEFSYFGEDSTIFSFINIRYSLYLQTIYRNLLTDFVVNVSDSICDIGSLDYLKGDSQNDSILYKGKYYTGTYFPKMKILYNAEIGLIKFIDNQNIHWQLIQKK